MIFKKPASQILKKPASPMKMTRGQARQLLRDTFSSSEGTGELCVHLCSNDLVGSAKFWLVEPLVTEDLDDPDEKLQVARSTADYQPGSKHSFFRLQVDPLDEDDDDHVQGHIKEAVFVGTMPIDIVKAAGCPARW